MSAQQLAHTSMCPSVSLHACQFAWVSSVVTFWCRVSGRQERPRGNRLHPYPCWIPAKWPPLDNTSVFRTNTRLRLIKPMIFGTKYIVLLCLNLWCFQIFPTYMCRAHTLNVIHCLTNKKKVHYNFLTSVLNSIAETDTTGGYSDTEQKGTAFPLISLKCSIPRINPDIFSQWAMRWQRPQHANSPSLANFMLLFELPWAFNGNRQHP